LLHLSHGSLVVAVFTPRDEPEIPGFVATFHLAAIQVEIRVIPSLKCDHVCEKQRSILSPSGMNVNAPATVVVKVPILGVMAPIDAR
jgi:hypothetical protein